MTITKQCTAKLVQAWETQMLGSASDVPASNASTSGSAMGTTPGNNNNNDNFDDDDMEPDVLTEAEMAACMQEIMSGSLPNATVAGFLVALRMSRRSPPSVSMLAACAASLLDFAVPCRPNVPATSMTPALVDIVGTGGDGCDAFNVSTAAGLVMAACGLTVAKHGNRSSSGKVGSADFLEALGANIQLSGKQVEQCIERCGYGFLFAQRFHPAMKHVAAVRKQIGIRTIFNLLGPLSNPAGATHKVIGVSDVTLGPIFARILQRHGTKHGLVVHSADGLDEFSPSMPSLVWEVRADRDTIAHYTVEPGEHFGCEPCSLDAVCGGSLEERVAAFRRVLDGDTTSPIARFIIINAAAGVYAADGAASLRSAADHVRAVLASGGARVLTDTYVGITRELKQQQQQVQQGGDGDQGKQGACDTSRGVGPDNTRTTSADVSQTSTTTHDDDDDDDDDDTFDETTSTIAAHDPAGDESDGDENGADAAGDQGPGTSQQQQRVRTDRDHTYTTQHGIRVHRSCTRVNDVETHVRALSSVLDTHLGLLMCSDYEQPGRYTKWVTGFSDPPIMLVTRGRTFTITALNKRGEVLLPPIASCLRKERMAIASVEATTDVITGTVHKPGRRFPEEQRSRQPSAFSVMRSILSLFHSDEDNTLGLYGAFGYDLAFQFEDTELRLERPPNQRDMVLFLPDRVLRYDVTTKRGHVYSYDFEFNGQSTVGLDRYGPRFAYTASTHRHQHPRIHSRGSNSSNSNTSSKRASPPTPQTTATNTSNDTSDADAAIVCDHKPGEYAAKVRLAKEKFKVGDLFEAVLSQSFHAPCPSRPSRLFHRLRRRNPAPYAFIVSLGSKEYLVGASPEMYRPTSTSRTRIETCPISGTIRRGKDAMEDSRNIVTLLSSPKEEAELTMCTDVDRNDKSRICEAGSVRLLARRQIERYSKLIHTVDHVEGVLRPGYDALDAFLCHTWAVTVTGAPKPWAMQFVEDTEASARRWYAGAVGMIYFNGDMNTGLTLRTIHIEDGNACVRAGATLLWDSDPDAEEAETRLKASAFLDALLHTHAQSSSAARKRTKSKAVHDNGNDGRDRDGDDDDGDGDDDDAVAQPQDVMFSDDEGDDDEYDDDDDAGHGALALGRRTPDPFTSGRGLKVVVVDHEDSFVHTLSNYLRQTGADVVTFRAGFDVALLDSERPDAVLMSPGPGCPSDFNTSATITQLLCRNIPIFGVCLGLQAMVEHFGGALDVLPEPLHGKPSSVSVVVPSSRVFDGLPSSFVVARYHSLYARLENVPSPLTVTAISDDGVVMAVEHKSLPLAAVQFHPESILTGRDTGVHILNNALQWFEELKNTPSAPSTPSRATRISTI
ncbi:anthranilate synthase [Salpingoeca rosetta]|uniref:anthranilate phosphoribosyltransferase n=1 Tax=Salpingoeca rosetta (strain ATCC 50818 / BSB-021) TaxID=946362 RepID=F2UCM6_SALR5|nr:anthranilate synthase [Salpingoeca rosetta]EGD74333.1 anthranilate synthase [Salpingoeca rosetta]|eukprot:XP_004993233.1 anthranilate synthase [Salpingoeca rosetta]